MNIVCFYPFSSNYYRFGLPSRAFQPGYKWGFNGKENDREVLTGGRFQDYGFRAYRPDLGRFFALDPLTRDYPFYTPYQFAGNDVIRNIDLDGLEPTAPYFLWEQVAMIKKVVMDKLERFFGLKEQEAGPSLKESINKNLAKNNKPKKVDEKAGGGTKPTPDLEDSPPEISKRDATVGTNDEKSGQGQNPGAWDENSRETGDSAVVPDGKGGYEKLPRRADGALNPTGRKLTESQFKEHEKNKKE